MRTTITVAPDVAAELDRLRREEGLGPSDALNALARRGMAARTEPPKPYLHRSSDLGLKVDVHDIGGVLELLDEEQSRA